MAENNISRAIEHVESILQQLRSGHPGFQPLTSSTNPQHSAHSSTSAFNSFTSSTPRAFLNGIQTDSRVLHSNDALQGYQPINPRTTSTFIPSSAESHLRSSIPPARCRSNVGQTKYRGLYAGCFKKLEDAPLTVESLMAAFKPTDDPDVKDALQKLRTYLHWRVERGKPFKDFLIWLTGLPVLLSCDCLTLFVTAQGRYVEVDVCKKWLKMAKCVLHDALIEQFETALKDPAF